MKTLILVITLFMLSTPAIAKDWNDNTQPSDHWNDSNNNDPGYQDSQGDYHHPRTMDTQQGGATDPDSGQYIPQTSDRSYTDPRDGTLYQDTGNGYMIDTNTGRMIPVR